MPSRQKVYLIFYLLGFTLAIVLGLITSFKGDSHTPPAPYILELLVLPIGLILFLIDMVITRPLNFKNLRVHVFGLGVNAALVAGMIFYA